MTAPGNVLASHCFFREPSTPTIGARSQQWFSNRIVEPIVFTIDGIEALKDFIRKLSIHRPILSRIRTCQFSVQTEGHGSQDAAAQFKATVIQQLTKGENPCRMPVKLN